MDSLITSRSLAQEPVRGLSISLDWKTLVWKTLDWKTLDWNTSRRSRSCACGNRIPSISRELFPQALSFYFNSTIKTSPRQSVPMVQAALPDSEPNCPIQSEEKMKNLPSWEIVPMPHSVLNLWERVLVKS